MTQVTFSPDLLKTEEALRAGLIIGAGGIVSFSPESIDSTKELFAPLDQWVATEQGRDAVIAASGKILVDEAKDIFASNPDLQAISLTLPLGNDSVDHRFNRNNELRSSYIARGATEQAEELALVHQYAATLFKDTE
jgi:hypothetical protein